MGIKKDEFITRLIKSKIRSLDDSLDTEDSLLEDSAKILQEFSFEKKGIIRDETLIDDDECDGELDFN